MKVCEVTCHLDSIFYFYSLLSQKRCHCLPVHVGTMTRSSGRKDFVETLHSAMVVIFVLDTKAYLYNNFYVQQLHSLSEV